MKADQRSSVLARIFALIGAAGILAGILLDLSPAGSTIPWIPLDRARVESRRTGKPVLLDIYGDWCRPCRKMDAEVFSIDSVRSAMETDFILARLDVGKLDTMLAMLSGLEVESIPTMVILTPQGLEVKRHSGLMDSSSLLQWLRDRTNNFLLSWPALPDARVIASRSHTPCLIFWMKSHTLLDRTYGGLRMPAFQQFLSTKVVPTVVIQADSAYAPVLEEFKSTRQAAAAWDRYIFLTGWDGREIAQLRIEPKFDENPGMLLDTLRTIVGRL